MNSALPRLFPAIFLVVAAVVLAPGQTIAQQVESDGSTTNAAAPPRQWKDKMLENQLRGSVVKSLGFNADSLNGMAVHPETSQRSSESGENKYRREKLEQVKFFLMMNADDSMVDATVDELVRLQNLNGDAQISKSPLESLYIEQLLHERAAATNRAKAEMDARNEPDSTRSFNPTAQGRDSIQNNSLINDSFSPSRKSSGNLMFQSLLNPPQSSPDQLRLQQDRNARFRTMLDSGTSPGQPRSPSGFEKMLNGISAQPNVGGYKPSAPPVAIAKPVTPAYQPPPPKTPSIFDDSPPRRKF